MKRFGNPRWKSVAEPSVDAYEAEIKLYRGFIEHFPSSSYVEEAKAQIASLETGLEEERKREQAPAPPSAVSKQ
jgi:hypothetical protein